MTSCCCDSRLVHIPCQTAAAGLCCQAPPSSARLQELTPPPGPSAPPGTQPQLRGRPRQHSPTSCAFLQAAQHKHGRQAEQLTCRVAYMRVAYELTQALLCTPAEARHCPASITALARVHLACAWLAG